MNKLIGKSVSFLLGLKYSRDIAFLISQGYTLDESIKMILPRAEKDFNTMVNKLTKLFPFRLWRGVKDAIEFSFFIIKAHIKKENIARVVRTDPNLERLNDWFSLANFKTSDDTGNLGTRTYFKGELKVLADLSAE